MRILSKNTLVVLYDRRIDAHTVSFGYKMAGELKPFCRSVSSHGSGKAWKETSGFCDGCADVVERLSFVVFNWRREEAGFVSGVDFSETFLERGGVSHQIVEAGTEGDCGAVCPGDAKIKSLKLRETRWE
jgi:hypothetical protein